VRTKNGEQRIKGIAQGERNPAATNQTKPNVRKRAPGRNLSSWHSHCKRNLVMTVSSAMLASTSSSAAIIL
jgi:hypothetical protein